MRSSYLSWQGKPSNRVSGRDRPHVLVVDDHALNRLLLTRVAEAAGATAAVAADGEKALETLGDGGFDLVFMDIAMPGLDGIETTRQLRERGTTIPIVAVTAHYSQGEFCLLEGCGFDGLIPKPLDVSAVTDWIRLVRPGR